MSDKKDSIKLNFQKLFLGILLTSTFLLYPNYIYGQTKQFQEKVVYNDNFEGSLNTINWEVEMVPGNNAKVTTENSKLIIDVPYGVTVWFKKELTDNVIIEYDWKVVVADGKNDRLSDLNQFWMASDPKNKDLFTRNGKFANYDSLSLYYVGMGGNKNTTTRFRKYSGNGDRVLLKEYTDGSHLLKADHNYHIKIYIIDGHTSFWVDGKEYFSLTDPKPLRKGFFGFRTTHGRHEISNFKISR